MSKCNIVCHLRHLRFPKFSTGVLTRLAFGTVITVSIPVLINVVLRLISITSPSEAPTTTQSPTLNGRSSKTVNAPKKLEIVSLAARANARPEIPKPAISDVRSKPTASAMKIAPMKMIKNRRTLSRALTMVLSVPSLTPSESSIITTSWTTSTKRNAQTTTAKAIMN